MGTKEFQKKCADIVSKIDKKYKVKRDAQLGMCQLIEEIGELAKELDKKKLNGKSLNKKNLSLEFADVIMLLCKLAEMNNIDIEDSVDEKAKILKKRGYL